MNRAWVLSADRPEVDHFVAEPAGTHVLRLADHENITDAQLLPSDEVVDLVGQHLAVSRIDRLWMLSSTVEGRYKFGHVRLLPP
jgi:hypothetical protein